VGKLVLRGGRCGDKDINDLLARGGVLSIQQTGKCPKLLCEEADVVIKDIKEIVGVIESRVLKS
jgi:soluble P-type ATPase